jgi:hypothetical protein
MFLLVLKLLEILEEEAIHSGDGKNLRIRKLK